MSAPRKRVAGGFLLCAIGAACGDLVSDRFLVNELRILAMRAEPPEIMPGGSAVLDALIADPLGEGRPVSYVWGLCTPDPAAGVASCGEPGRTVPLGVGTSQTITVAADILDGLPPDVQEQGIDLFAVLQASATVGADGEEATDQAFKRVRVSTSTAPNTNPVIASFASPPPTGTEGEELAFEAVPTGASMETYEGPTGPITEEMRYTWLATAGELDAAVSYGETTTGIGRVNWLAETPATLWVVLRDPRGGITWAAKSY